MRPRPLRDRIGKMSRFKRWFSTVLTAFRRWRLGADSGAGQDPMVNILTLLATKRTDAVLKFVISPQMIRFSADVAGRTYECFKDLDQHTYPEQTRRDFQEMLVEIEYGLSVSKMID
jgi:hypothetical protein